MPESVIRIQMNVIPKFEKFNMKKDAGKKNANPRIKKCNNNNDDDGDANCNELRKCNDLNLHLKFYSLISMFRKYEEKNQENEPKNLKITRK